MVDAREVDHLKGEWLLVEVVQLAEGDVELDLPKGDGLLRRHNSKEQHVVGM
jgi:hypothetical protein